MTTAPPILEDQFQHDRTARAQAALLNGDMQVMVLTDCAWIVASNRSHYTVSLNGDASRKDTGTVWDCTCPDFSGRCQRFGLRCKHIEAVRLTESGLASQYTYPQFSTLHTEEPMTQSMPTHDPSGEQILWRLRQPLDMNRVKRRQAPNLGSVPYLEGYDVIETANDLFAYRWSFELLSEPHVMRWDRLVTFYDQRLKKKVPLLGEDGQPVTEVAGIAYITGRITVELDGKAYNHADAGRCIFNGDTPEALDMAIAGAVTDCLKRCFRQLGEQFGNRLYDKEIARTAGLEIEPSNGNGSHGKKQSAKPANQPAAPPNPIASQAEPPQYRDGVAVDTGNAAEWEAFNAFQSAHQGLAPASREALRAWAAGRNGKK
ncbi:MAG: Rad52/Rad22 family DNA repair protein [Bellilinea sp.]|jgi:hypothetical protein